MALIALERGELDKALELAEQVYALQKGATTTSYHTLAKVHMALGNETEVRRLLQQRIEMAQHGFVQAILPANIYAWLGEMDAAFEWLEKEYDAYGAAGWGEYQLQRLYDNLRDDPRWLAHLNRTGTAPEQLAELELLIPNKMYE